MSNHLTEDQIAKCFAGQASEGERQHVQQCAACGAELDRLTNSISLFRSAVRERIDVRVALHPTQMRTFEPQPHATTTPLWNWAVVAAVAFVLVTLPFFISDEKRKCD